MNIDNIEKQKCINKFEEIQLLIKKNDYINLQKYKQNNFPKRINPPLPHTHKKISLIEQIEQIYIEKESDRIIVLYHLYKIQGIQNISEQLYDYIYYNPSRKIKKDYEKKERIKLIEEQIWSFEENYTKQKESIIQRKILKEDLRLDKKLRKKNRKSSTSSRLEREIFLINRMKKIKEFNKKNHRVSR